MNFDYMTEEEAKLKADTYASGIDPSKGVDMVNSPPHYQGEVECIDAIRSALGEDGFKAYCRGTSMKYIWRTGKKWDAEQDVRKAIWYLNQLLE